MVNQYNVKIEYLMADDKQVFKTVTHRIIAKTAEEARAFVCNHLELRGERHYRIADVREKI